MFWRKSLVSDLGGKIPEWGFTESPLIVGKVIIVTPGGAEGVMAGLDKRTGEVLWRTKDVTDATQYSSPIFVEFGGQAQVVQLITKKLFSVDPANGKLLWLFATIDHYSCEILGWHIIEVGSGDAMARRQPDI